MLYMENVGAQGNCHPSIFYIFGVQNLNPSGEVCDLMHKE
jgi:hypothetical protein